MRLVPFVRSVHLRIPGIRGGFNWSKPASMLVSFPDGREEVLPIPDITRKYVIFTVLWGILGWLFLSFLWRRIASNHNERAIT